MKVYHFYYDMGNGDSGTIIVIETSQDEAINKAKARLPEFYDQLNLVREYELTDGVLMDSFFDHETHTTDHMYPMMENAG